MQPGSGSSRLHVSQRRLHRGAGRVDEHCHTSGCSHQLAQQSQPLCRQLSTEKIDACRVPARPGEAGDKAKPDGIVADDKNDGDRSGYRLGRERRSGASGRGDHRDLPTNQFGRQSGQPIHLILSPAVFDRHVLALDIAGVLQALAECAQAVRDHVRRSGFEKSDHRHRRLLRARRARPCRRCAAEQRDELAPPDVEHEAPSQGCRCRSYTGPRSLAQAVCHICSLPVECAAGPWARPESY